MSGKDGYEAISQCEKSEKPPLVRADSATAPVRASRQKRPLVLLLSGVLSGLVLIATGLAIHRGILGGCSRRIEVYQAPGERLVKRQFEAEQPVTTTASERPKYSTTVYDDGKTSTFVFTTRPIVNPGGYTIGTLTAYVPLTTPVATDASSSSTTFTRETSTLPPLTPTTTTTLRTKAAPSTSLTTLPPPATPTPFGSGAFTYVDAHILHKNGLDFEDSQSDSEVFGEPTADEVTVEINASSPGTAHDELKRGV